MNKKQVIDEMNELVGLYQKISQDKNAKQRELEKANVSIQTYDGFLKDQQRK